MIKLAAALPPPPPGFSYSRQQGPISTFIRFARTAGTRALPRALQSIGLDLHYI